MTRDARFSRKIFDFARKSSAKSHVAVFFASHLLWLMLGVAGSIVFPEVQLLVPIIFLPWGVSLLISEIIRRERPFHPEGYKPIIHLLVETPSFPSSHSTVAFALVAAFINDPIVWPFMLVGAIFVALGRVAVGVHYTSDVVVGAVLGFVLAYAMKIGMLLLNL
ncbi:phosphatase PAP2 family protein [Candidatus Uhrbacteria bacterium]|nr:phosphatase PAP2 family protein [Candidatus Uhrbacteria bacterium]